MSSSELYFSSLDLLALLTLRVMLYFFSSVFSYFGETGL